MDKTFKPIPNFPDYKILIPILLINRKYYSYKLRKNMKTYLFLAHRLVAQTFIPNKHNKPEVNHKDGNGLNNNIDNLEWVTHKENMQHAGENKLMKPVIGTNNMWHKLEDKDVRYIKKCRRNNTKSVKELSKKYNVHIQTIYNIIWGKKWKHIK